LKVKCTRVVAITLALGLILGCEWTGSHAEDTPKTDRSEATAASNIPPVGGAISPSPFVVVADKVMPGVVSIDTKRKVETTSPFEIDEPFGRIFRDLIPDLKPREYQVPTYASGFIFDSSGYVVTNHHVVKGGEQITVRMMDETEFEAEVIGSDPNTDVAILKIEAGRDLPAVRLGDSESIRVGDWAIAIGNPFGRLTGTVTVGVISAKGRSALSIAGGTPALQDFIQTDASINFGNSGGPLVNISGEAVGMNTAINPLGQGIGFAIPINLVRHVADEIIKYGKVSWAYLGILPQEITNDLADALGVKPRSGILVGSVVEDAPADKAGIRRGDIITEFNNDKVGDVDQFRLKVAGSGVDKEVPLVVLRDGDRKTFKVRLGERPTELAEGGTRKIEDEWIGLRVDDARGSRGRRYAPPDLDEGVIVIGVEENSPAEEAGIRVGDLIEEVNGEETRNLSEYEEQIDKAKDKEDKPVLLLIRREQTNRYIAVKPRRK
jgi:serine protease Do